MHLVQQCSWEVVELYRIDGNGNGTGMYTCATSIANYGESNFKRLLVQQEVGRWVRVY